MVMFHSYFFYIRNYTVCSCYVQSNTDIIFKDCTKFATKAFEFLSDSWFLNVSMWYNIYFLALITNQAK